MKKLLLEKFKDSLSAVLPISIIVLVLIVGFFKIDLGNTLMFVFAAICLVIGIAIYNLGIDLSLSRVGEKIGAAITKKQKIWLFVLFGLVLGFLITVAEPNLSVLAVQTGIDRLVLIVSIGIGIGVFLVIALLRIVFQIPLKYILLGGYAIIFILGVFLPEKFVPMAFESGGVTTGPLTVPFIMSIGVGVAYIRGDKGSQDDNFGLIGTSLIGAIIAVMILGLIYESQGKLDSLSAEASTLHEINSVNDFFNIVLSEAKIHLKEVAIALLPMLLVYLVMHFIFFKDAPRVVFAIIGGFFVTYIGLTIFLIGANTGFLAIGGYLGSTLAEYNKWLLPPLALVLGTVIVLAEPSVSTLKNQVRDVTDGAISNKTLMAFISVGVGVAVSLAMLRAITGISIWWIIIPTYALSLGLSFIVPKLFTAIAFDSGAIVSGPLAAAFLLPMAIGATTQVGGDVFTDAIGIVSFVAMAPPLTIQLLGLIYKFKERVASKVYQEEIIYF
ncbi:MAG TPA: DUF1538 domain-containing protein [Acholeplasma sp.]|nr:DUF1538 domain-containing protein [Acholeplasma sp.]